MKKPDFKNLLRGAGFKITPARVELLNILWAEQKPLAVHALEKKLKERMNEVTLYRALEALAQARIIRRVDLGHTHAHYEMEKEHHHHLVCTDCGDIEDVEVCPLPALAREIGKGSRKFSTIYSHSAEFFGLCRVCLPVRKAGSK